ncbi:hypothetical protein SAMD00079811_35170 [Scytonema sp. HK-05]|jgi:hypothetical protein|nr:hypothetical protein SAMD00079811_35170 [Scytonema sp. HK-05]
MQGRAGESNPRYVALGQELLSDLTALSVHLELGQPDLPAATLPRMNRLSHRQQVQVQP